MLLFMFSLLVALFAPNATSFPGPFRDSTRRTSTADTGTFQNPAVRVKPKFRYWLPDASIDTVHLADDIKSIGDIGAGGIEFCNFYLYGGEIGGTPATDWDVYGFGTPAYNLVLKAALQATQENGLIMDFAMGPQSGQGVPAEPNDLGLATDLGSYNVTVSPGQTYSGKIPGYGNPGTLVSLTTAIILDEASFSELSKNFSTTELLNYTVYTISADNLTDITNTVKSDGSIMVDFPPNAAGVKLIVYASYYTLSGARACIPGQAPQSLIQNGSFAVDHFSERGAQVTTDFLEQYLLVDGIRELFQQNGNYIWEDSVEIPSSLYWTPAFAATFKQMHGYDIGKYTMLLSYNNGLQFNTFYPTRFVSSTPTLDYGIIADYRATLSYLLTTYYDHLVQWSNDYLGLPFSGQVGYNMPVDMLEIVPHVNVPEDESLGFSDSIDAYKQYVGPANLAGKQIISNELGAMLLEKYQQTLPSLLKSVQRAYSAGNNQMVFHGAPYSYKYPNTTWPGYSSFEYLFSEDHSRHQPAWENGYSDMLNFVARTNFILQSGIPKRDIVFWNKQTGQNDSLPTLYNSLDLIEAGYGYEYISPENFQLPQAFVENGVLAPDGPAYKCLIIQESAILTTNGTMILAQWAKQGLPVIISGGMPTQIALSSGLSQAQATLQSILSLPNVHQIPSGPIAPILSSIGIQPLTKVSANQTWYTYWRQDDQNSYIYLYNDGNYSTGTVSFANTGSPFFLDAWTGEETPILDYTVASGYTTIPFNLAPSQARIVAFLSNPIFALPEAHVTSAPPSVLGFYLESTGLNARVSAGTASGIITTSDNKKHFISGSGVPSAFALQNWILIVEKWGPPADLNDIDTVAMKTNTTYQLPELQSWPLISGLQNTSGVGYYSTTFTWTNTSLGAIIDFGRVVHTLRVKINGQQLPALDFTSPKADISQYLVEGKNSVEAVVATTMINGLAPILLELRTSGSGPIMGLDTFTSTEVESGLVVNVIVTPYIGVKLAS